MRRLGATALLLGLAFFFGLPLCFLLWQARAPGLSWTEVWLAPASLHALAGTVNIHRHAKLQDERIKGFD